MAFDGFLYQCRDCGNKSVVPLCLCKQVAELDKDMMGVQLEWRTHIDTHTRGYTHGDLFFLKEIGVQP